MSKILELRQALGKAVDELPNFIDNEAEFNTREAGIKDLQAQIARAEIAMRHAAGLARPVEDTDTSTQDAAAAAAAHDLLRHPAQPMRATSAMFGHNSRGIVAPPQFDDYLRMSRMELDFAVQPSKHYRTLGEQLQAVFTHYQTKGSTTDSRLVRAPTGASEVDPTGGGFLVQTDFANAIFMLAHEMGDILARTGKLPISSNANGIKVPGVDETSRVTGSRWGGVASYWAGEGTTVTTTKPKFRLVEFDLKKLMSVMYTTDELLQDSTALGAIAGQAFSEEVMFMTEDAIYEGTGAGQPLGILNSPCLISVAKEKGQGSATIVYENLLNMWARMWARSRRNAAWFINQDIEPQLLAVAQAIGTAGVPVYLPPGGLSQLPYGQLFGRPVIPVEYSATLGTVGDITLNDFSQYYLADKGGVSAAQSMHVAFLTDEMVFRITYRVDGKPMWSKDLTPFKGTATKSPFIALASR